MLKLLILTTVKSHMEMLDPEPRRSMYNKYYSDKDNPDYEMASPLNEGVMFILILVCFSMSRISSRGSY